MTSRKLSSYQVESYMSKKVIKTNEEWQKLLTGEQYHVTREKGTEAPFSGKYVYPVRERKTFSNGVYNKKKGTYTCACCGAVLFSADAKFDSGTGWPSFSDAVDKANVELKEDTSLGMVRTEVLCASCGAHLGHLFQDGPKPTGMRYCINSVALDFKKALIKN